MGKVKCIFNLKVIGSLLLSLFINIAIIDLSFHFLKTKKVQKYLIEVVTLNQTTPEKATKNALKSAQKKPSIAKPTQKPTTNSLIPKTVNLSQLNTSKKKIARTPITLSSNTQTNQQPNSLIPKNTQAFLNENSTQQPQQINKNLTQIISKQDYAFIRDLVMKNLRYPYIARRNNWEGTVVVSFLIKDGHPVNIKIIQSSRYNILDKNTVEAIKKLENLKINHKVEIVLPITYKLDEKS